MFGADANWGRVLCAVGYSGADVDVSAVDVTFASEAGEIAVCKTEPESIFPKKPPKRFCSRTKSAS